MNTFLTLIRREWLQHRFGWAMLVLVPLVIALPLLSVGEIELDNEASEHLGERMAIVITAVSLAATVAVMLILLGGASAIQMATLARRDHADRSVEFWLSLPVGHGASLAVPLLVHLVLVPLAAVGLGLLGGLLVSMVVVSRLEGFSAWIGLPWGTVLAAAGAAMVRLLVGIPLATLWLLPVTLVVVLAGAWFKKWAVPALLAGFGVASLVLEQRFGVSLLREWVAMVFREAGHALINSGARPMVVRGPEDALSGLQGLPGWLLRDIVPALGMAWSPVFLVGLVISAACFWLLLRWRSRI